MNGLCRSRAFWYTVDVTIGSRCRIHQERQTRCEVGTQSEGTPRSLPGCQSETHSSCASTLISRESDYLTYTDAQEETCSAVTYSSGSRPNSLS